MRYLQSSSTNPYWNLALEQYVFDNLSPKEDYFMLWQNDNAIIVGKHQNTAAEINAAFVKEQDIKVVRRLSGGGAVYHDLGNLNFTFIADSEGAGFDFSTFCRPVVNALKTLGVHAQISGRNDMTIDGKKFSGNAMYKKRGRVMHHGTLMFDSNLQILSKALIVPKDKIESKGIKSVRSRVTNILPYMKEERPISVLIDALCKFMDGEYGLDPYSFTDDDRKAVQTLCDNRYSSWDWNYGKSPKYSIQKSRRVEGCGKIELFLDIQGERIKAISCYGDFFGDGELSELSADLKDCPMREADIRSALKGVSIDQYVHNLSNEEFIAILLS